MNFRNRLAFFKNLRTSADFRRNATNSGYSVAEYVAYPCLVLITTPFLVSRLGWEQYGIWMLVIALTGSLGLFNVGLGDAVIKYVSSYRSKSDLPGIVRIVRSSLGLSLILGGLVILIALGLAQLLVQYIFKIEQQNKILTILAIRIGAVILAVRFLEAVFLSALRGHERYDLAAKVSIVTRVSGMVLAVILAALRYSVIEILLGTVLVNSGGVIMAAVVCRKLTGNLSLLPSFDKKTWKEIWNFWLYSWLQGIGAIFFSHVDRLVITAFLGTTALGIYSVCLQLAQQVHSLLAPAFSFLFPWVSARGDSFSLPRTRGLIRWTVFLNVSGATFLALIFFLFGKEILTLWMGSEFANKNFGLFLMLVIAFFILSVNTVTYYILLGVGKIRLLTFSTLSGGILSLLASIPLIQLLGLPGSALTRIVYSVFTGVIMTFQLVKLWNYSRLPLNAEAMKIYQKEIFYDKSLEPLKK